VRQREAQRAYIYVSWRYEDLLGFWHMRWRGEVRWRGEKAQCAKLHLLAEVAR